MDENIEAGQDLRTIKDEVEAWDEDVVIPTYGTGKPDKNPMFLERRVYQGSSGVVYPYPIVEKVFDKPIDKAYKACFLENKYVKIMILPELGGRVQMAFDKIKKRHFIYHQDVIKPALVGLTGPWISGGIEFNWPQHHRPSTFDPVDYYIERNSDGSKTVWCSEVERMFGTKGMVGFTLYPDKAYLELKVRLYNRTPFPQTFLWWANPAVHVNDSYQSVFPPDVHAVFDHGRRDVSRFPIATGTYYKIDYSEGVDISWYKNIPVPTSYMAVESKYDFLGGYEHDTGGGLLHVADHHISPGKKQWSWGNGEFGRAWDRNLTDNNGPYVEIMCGVFTDNQPDFSWLMPYEEKSFEQYFMPYRDLGVVKNATKDALINLEIIGEKAVVKAYTTGVFENSSVELTRGHEIIMNERFDFSPEVSFEKSVHVGRDVKPEELSVRLRSPDHCTLVTWRPEKHEIIQIPGPARKPDLPQEISQNETLFLTGLHLEQYRHATYNPTDYYLEALRRDPGDIRSNNAMGLWLMRHGQFADAEPYFRKAIGTLTSRNPNPYDGEPFYNLGMSLKLQGRLEEAFDSFYKCVWNAAWQDAGYLALAQVSSQTGHLREALDCTKRSLVRNSHNHKARHLMTALLRKLGQHREATEFADQSLSLDRFNFGCLFEKYLTLVARSQPHEAKKIFIRLKRLMRENIQSYIAYAIDYHSAGLFDEATSLLLSVLEEGHEAYPLLYYLLGYFASSAGNSSTAIKYYAVASSMKPDYCFPNRIEESLALLDALKLNPNDSKAYYYLGDYWYANRQYRIALSCWEHSAVLDATFPTVFRNLSLAYFNKLKEPGKALKSLEKAFELDRSDARILMELDQLYKRIGRKPNERLALLENHLQLVESRDDLFLERVTLYNQLGQFVKAEQLISQRIFHPWEGGEGKVTHQYVISKIELAKLALKEKHFSEALRLLAMSRDYPPNLGEGKLHGANENDIDFYAACAFEGLGSRGEMLKHLEKASIGVEEPSPIFFYNDQRADSIFFQGLALRKLDNEDNARRKFNKLIDYGEQHLFDDVKIDYFAVSLPDFLIWEDALNRRNQVYCYYLLSLGHLGLNHLDKAFSYKQKSLELDPNFYPSELEGQPWIRQ